MTWTRVWAEQAACFSNFQGGQLGCIVLQNHNVTIIRFKCPDSWKGATFTWFIDVISIKSKEKESKRGKRAIACMIHGFSLNLPERFCPRTLLNVYNMEKFTISLLPQCLLFAFGWKLTFDWWLWILFLPSWISSLLFLEDLVLCIRSVIECTVLECNFHLQ